MLRESQRRSVRYSVLNFREQPRYTRRHMRPASVPSAPRAVNDSDDGPWGDAIQYWLKKRGLRQSDIARTAPLEANTVSRAARGYHTSTRVLAKIARALQIPIESVLVPPQRAIDLEEREQYVRHVVGEAMRQFDEQALAQATKTLETIAEHQDHYLARHPARRKKPRHK